LVSETSRELIDGTLSCQLSGANGLNGVGPVELVGELIQCLADQQVDHHD